MGVDALSEVGEVEPIAITPVACFHLEFLNADRLSRTVELVALETDGAGPDTRHADFLMGKMQVVCHALTTPPRLRQ